MVVNKWDLVEDKTTVVMNEYEYAIRHRMAPFDDFPIIFASALTKQRIFKVLETAKEVYQNRKKRVATAKLNEEMLPLIEAYPPLPSKVNTLRLSIACNCRIRNSLFCVLCQFAAICERALPSFPGKQDTRTLGFQRYSY